VQLELLKFLEKVALEPHDVHYNPNIQGSEEYRSSGYRNTGPVEILGGYGAPRDLSSSFYLDETLGGDCTSDEDCSDVETVVEPVDPVDPDCQSGLEVTEEANIVDGLVEHDENEVEPPKPSQDSAYASQEVEIRLQDDFSDSDAEDEEVTLDSPEVVEKRKKLIPKSVDARRSPPISSKSEEAQLSPSPPTPTPTPQSSPTSTLSVTGKRGRKSSSTPQEPKAKRGKAA
jgi:hypothetical protein